MSNFFFCHYVFKKLSAAEASESIFIRERINRLVVGTINIIDMWCLLSTQITVFCRVIRERYCSKKQPHQSSLSMHVSETSTLTLSTIGRISSSLDKYLGKPIKHLYKWKYNHWIELKILWQRRNCSIVLSNFFLCHIVFKSHLLQRYHLYVGKG